MSIDTLNTAFFTCFIMFLILDVCRYLSPQMPRDQWDMWANDNGVGMSEARRLMSLAT